MELTAAPRDLIAAGAFAPNVTILFGTNADEGSEFIDLDYDASEEEYAAYMEQVLVLCTQRTSVAPFVCERCRGWCYELGAESFDGPTRPLPPRRCWRRRPSALSLASAPLPSTLPRTTTSPAWTARRAATGPSGPAHAR